MKIPMEHDHLRANLPCGCTDQLSAPGVGHQLDHYEHAIEIDIRHVADTLMNER